MNGSGFSIYLSDQVVLNNMQMFASFKVRDKPLMDFKTGAIKKEDRVLASWMRSAWGGFDKECANETLKRAVEIIEKASSDHTKGTKKIKTGSTALTIHSIFLKTIIGIQNIAKTYRSEGKGGTADRLDAIADEYYSCFSNLSNLEQIRKSKNSASLRRRRPSPTRRSNLDDTVMDILKLQSSPRSSGHKKSGSGTMELSLLENVVEEGSMDDVSVQVEVEEKVVSTTTTSEDKHASESPYHIESPLSAIEKEKEFDRESKEGGGESLDYPIPPLEMKREEESKISTNPFVSEDEDSALDIPPNGKMGERTIYQLEVTDGDMEVPKKRGLLYQIFCCGCLRG